MPAPNPRFRPWPKRFDGMRNIIDRDKIRQQFLSGDHYDWIAFCTQYNYDPAMNKRKEFPVRAWQQEWLQQQVQATEDGLMTEAISVKRQIAKARLEFPAKWQNTSTGLKQLADFILAREMAKAKHDQEHQDEILAGKRQALCTLTPSFLGQLALAQIRVQELQRAALLMPAADAYRACIPIRDTDPIEVEAESEEERLKSLEVKLVGGGTLTEEKMMQIHSKWIDQQALDPLDGASNEDQKTEERSPETDYIPPTEVPV